MKLNTYMKLKERIRDFLHDEKLKRKLYVIIFESDTPAGKLFDVVLIGCILVSVLLVIIESLKSIPSYLTTPFVIMEYLFTAFFTFEYLTRIYCSPRPRKYIFSFFGIVDLLATLPLYIGLLFPGARYLLIIRAFRLYTRIPCIQAVQLPKRRRTATHRPARKQQEDSRLFSCSSSFW